MSEEKQTFWDKLFGGPSREAREKKVLQYIIHRLEAGANLKDVTEEEYVRQTLSQDEIDEVINNPKLVHAAHEQLEQEFESEKLRPEPPSR